MREEVVDLKITARMPQRLATSGNHFWQRSKFLCVPSHPTNIDPWYYDIMLLLYNTVYLGGYMGICSVRLNMKDFVLEMIKQNHLIYCTS